MTRKLYIAIFIALAVTFVPVLLNCGIVTYIVPSGFIAIFAGGALVRGKLAQAFWSFGLLAIYLLIFYAAARFVFWISTRSTSPTVRRGVQLIALLALFSCSFFRVVTYSSLQGNGGIYSFWTATSRYLDKHDFR